MKSRASKFDVLIADDHKIFRVGLSAMLHNVSSIATVHEAVNGKEAIAILAKHPCRFVFMDIKMPVMDGIAATKAITQSHPHVHVIAMSVYDEDRYIEDMFASGAKGYLLKNTDQEEIERAIQTVLDGHPYYTKSVSDKLLRRLMPSTNANAYQAPLTLKEKEILYYLYMEMSSKEIATKIFVSAKSVELHRSKLMDKTGCKNTVALVKYALQHGVVTEWEEMQKENTGKKN